MGTKPSLIISYIISINTIIKIIIILLNFVLAQARKDEKVKIKINYNVKNRKVTSS